jgi:hypothetical protein
MKSEKTELLVRLLQPFPPHGITRGRKLRPFFLGLQEITLYPLSSEAYAERLYHFKILVAIDCDCPCLDQIQEVKHRIGSVRLILLIYIYSYLPDFPDKDGELRDLQDTYESNLLIRGIQKIVLRELASGRIHDDQLASLILDDVILHEFATLWFSLEKTNALKTTLVKLKTGIVLHKSEREYKFSHAVPHRNKLIENQTKSYVMRNQIGLAR